MARKNFLKTKVFVGVVFSVFIIASLCRADNAMVLPQNRWMTNISSEIYPTWGKQYNDQGSAEDLAFDYNRDLDENVISDLNNFILLGLETDPSLGRSIVDFEKRAIITNLLLSYGISDKITLGLTIPYWNFKTKVSTALDQSSATIAKNPTYDPTDPTSSPIAPTALLAASGLPQATIDALKLTSEEVKALLSDGLDVNSDGTIDMPGYGYKQFETWSGSGLGDMELGVKYKYLQNTRFRLAVQGGIKFPSGREDDPDNLVDYGFGGGNYDISVAALNDYVGFKNFVITSSLRYTNQLPDKETLRTPDSVNQPLTTNKERVDRDQGDVLEMGFSTTYSFPRGFDLNGTYGMYLKDKDRVEGAGGHITSLEDETEQTGHTLLIGASYSNLSRFQQKLARVPFQLSLSYWNRFDGKNMNKATYYAAKAALFF